MQEKNRTTNLEKDLDLLSDPILVDFLRNLLAVASLATKCNRKSSKSKMFGYVLDICRLSRAIRLHVGMLSLMPSTAIVAMSHALESVISSGIEKVNWFSGKEKETYELAVRNIKQRLDMLEDNSFEHEAISAAASEDSELGRKAK